MSFKFSRKADSAGERQLERLLEMVPGLCSWTVLAGMIVLSFSKPLVAALLIIAFDLYWLLRILYMTIFLILSYLRLSMEKNTDWIKRAAAVNSVDAGRAQKLRWTEWKKRLSDHICQEEIKAFRKSNSLSPLLSDIRHLVIYPTIKEGREILEPAIESVVNSRFPTKQMVVVFAVEERASDEVKADVAALRTKYKSHFLDLLIVVHPDGIKGEARVKGANVTWAAKEAAKYFETKKIAFENVVVSCFDADTVVQADYFSTLTYKFMVTPERHRTSFQPIPVYHNNIWTVPGFARVIATGASFFQLIEATNPEKLVTFSSHSMSFKALVEIGYWPVDMISDDSAIFWKAYIHYGGAYHVVPMYVTLSMHVPDASSFAETVANVYKQQRRWAWGIENFPIVVRGFLKNPKISIYNKIRHSFKILENHVGWATWALLITLIGWLPVFFASRQFSDTVLYYSAPRVTAMIFDLSGLALLTTVIISTSLLPKRTLKRPLMTKLWMAFEWCFVPIICVVLSALPALDAQTRLLFGRYMEFWVTEKKGIQTDG